MVDLYFNDYWGVSVTIKDANRILTWPRAEKHTSDSNEEKLSALPEECS
jgi:hypothetical protein